jgi:exopolyphosphatase / guanosine-5'-triphosphate,3'-diphosphate pyrophosphatase
MPRVAVVDIGTNSTRLLVADVGADGVTELERRSIVTRLGEGLERSGELGEAPRRRVFDVLEQYAEAMDEHRAEVRTAVLTSAVRDASNGAAFTETVRERFGLDAETISGDEEAHLTFLGATAARDADDDATLLVVDIGGGSTELVAGRRGEVEFHVSTQVGVVRHTERHLDADPPEPEQVDALAADARETIAAALPEAVRRRVDRVIAVAGTATMAGAMDLGLEPYDAARVEGHRLGLDTLRGQLEHLAALPLEQRREVPGLHPDRAATIVAGIAILIEVLVIVGVDAVEVSDRDILWGRALDVAEHAGR